MPTGAGEVDGPLLQSETVQHEGKESLILDFGPLNSPPELKPLWAQEVYVHVCDDASHITGKRICIAYWGNCPIIASLLLCNSSN